MAFDRSEKLERLRALRSYWERAADAIWDETYDCEGRGLTQENVTRAIAIELLIARYDRRIAEELAHSDSLAGALHEIPTG